MLNGRGATLLLITCVVHAAACDGDAPLDAAALDGSTLDGAAADASREDGGPVDAAAGLDAGDTDGATRDGGGPIDDQLRAFPGAEGFGRHATGGRGGAVVAVTNLNDSGPGSLRDALRMTGPRTVVFRVGGTIEAESQLTIGADSGDLTIAGQTAPGDGVAIRGGELRIQASNVIVRFLRIRPGSDTTGSNEDGLRVIAYGGDLTENVIVDHCSVTWGKDENVEIGGIGDGSRVQNVTIQRSIIGENVDTHYGMLLWNRATQITVYGNLFIHNAERSIRSSTCTSSFEMVNNLVYSYRAGTVPTYENLFDVIGNVYRTNPALPTRFETIRLEASTGNCADGRLDRTRAFIADNLLDDGPATVSSNLGSVTEGAPIHDSGLTPSPASEVEAAVYADVGATVPARDAVDARLVEDARTRSGGLLSSEADVGGHPSLADGAPYPDEDGDGMDDDWEVGVGLDPGDPADGATDRDEDGYTNLEEFLHRLAVAR